MGWPIDGGDFEELTFEYTPEELGIDTKNAARIQEIKRLRPLVSNQPWGIFFVKFEPKRLPVVALRRILSQVALKKRASANSAERTAWANDDLLFVSNYGDGDERQISFAHFSTPSEWPRLADPQGARLGQPRHRVASRQPSPRELTDHLALGPTNEGDPERLARAAGAPPSRCATVRSSPLRNSSPSAWPSWPARSATASGRRSPSRPRPARLPSS